MKQKHENPRWAGEKICQTQHYPQLYTKQPASERPSHKKTKLTILQQSLNRVAHLGPTTLTNHISMGLHHINVLRTMPYLAGSGPPKLDRPVVDTVVNRNGTVRHPNCAILPNSDPNQFFTIAREMGYF